MADDVHRKGEAMTDALLKYGNRSIAILKNVTINDRLLDKTLDLMKEKRKMTKTKQLDEVRKTIRRWRRLAKANIKDCKEFFGDPMVPFWACRAETLLRCAEELEAMLDGRAEKRIDVPRDFTPK